MGFETLQIAASTPTALRVDDRSSQIFTGSFNAKHTSFSYYDCNRRATSNTPGLIPPEHSNSAYLKEEIGTVLQKCLKDVAFLHPVDPIEFIAKWLYKYRDNVMYFHEKFQLRRAMDEVVRARRRERHHQQRQQKIMKDEILKVKYAFKAGQLQSSQSPDEEGPETSAHYTCPRLSDVEFPHPKQQSGTKKSFKHNDSDGKDSIYMPNSKGELLALTSSMLSDVEFPHPKQQSGKNRSSKNNDFDGKDSINMRNPTGELMALASSRLSDVEFPHPKQQSGKKRSLNNNDSDGKDSMYMRNPKGELKALTSSRLSDVEFPHPKQQSGKKKSFKNNDSDGKDSMYMRNSKGELMALTSSRLSDVEFPHPKQQSGKMRSFKNNDSDGKDSMYMRNPKGEFVGLTSSGLSDMETPYPQQQSGEKRSSKNSNYGKDSVYTRNPEDELMAVGTTRRKSVPKKHSEKKDSQTTLILTNLGTNDTTTDDTLVGHTLDVDWDDRSSVCSRFSVFGGQVFEIFENRVECNDDIILRMRDHDGSLTQSDRKPLQAGQLGQEILKPKDQEKTKWTSYKTYTSDCSDTSDSFDERIQSVSQISTNNSTNSYHEERKVDDKVVELDGEGNQVCEGKWMFDLDRFALMCQHPLLGQLRHPCPPQLSHIDTPYAWQEKDFKACVHYDPELFTYSRQDTDSLLWVTRRVSFQENADSKDSTVKENIPDKKDAQ